MLFIQVHLCNLIRITTKQSNFLRKVVDNNVKIINDGKRTQQEMEMKMSNLKQAHAQIVRKKNVKTVQMLVQMDEIKVNHAQSMNIMRMKHEAEVKKMKRKLKKQKKTISECDKLRKKVDLYEGKAEMIDTMTLAQLNELKRTLQDTMNEIETAKEKKEECIVCKDNPCNVAFIGCGHCIICEECERNQTEKVCPQCQNPYSAVFKINK